MVVIVALISPSMIDVSGNIGNCLHFISDVLFPDKNINVLIFISASRIMGIFSWTISYKLLVYMYRKGLSEFWYSHKMFWLLNTLISFITTILQSKENTYRSGFIITTKVILIILNISLLGLMIKTKARTVEEPRPGLRVTSEGHIFIDPAEKTRRTTSYSYMKALAF